MLMAAAVLSVGEITIFSLKIIPYLVGTYASTYSYGSQEVTSLRAKVSLLQSVSMTIYPSAVLYGMTPSITR
jgi:hypothetical protein